MTRSVLQQAVRKSARRRTDINALKPSRVDAECRESSFKFETAAADILVLRRFSLDPDPSGGIESLRRFFHTSFVDEHDARHDERLRLCTGRRESGLGKKFVDTFFWH